VELSEASISVFSIFRYCATQLPASVQRSAVSPVFISVNSTGSSCLQHHSHGAGPLRLPAIRYQWGQGSRNLVSQTLIASLHSYQRRSCCRERANRAEYNVGKFSAELASERGSEPRPLSGLRQSAPIVGRVPDSRPARGAGRWC
jgi:hypothetical protein